MRYMDSLLADGEVVVRRARQHWLALLTDAGRGWLLLLLGLLALIVGLSLRGGDDPGRTIGNALSVVALVALVAGLADATYHVLRWSAQDFVVTNRRVVQVQGILNKRAADSSLEKINDAILQQSVLGRIFRYGDLEVLTASESAIDRFHMLARAADFKREMLNQKHALELEVGRAPAPPLRVEAPGMPGRAQDPAGRPGQREAVAPPAAAGVPTSPAAPATSGAGPSPRTVLPDADPQQITATLARLAALRDGGAITADEFEAKKAELLARL
ncbi:MAG TPA: PH domain-containing protein [Candidatus Acidoferrales bacterium]|nr:PH domain-containing protein [Candidatus Acidoferrales bacterium]